MDQEESGDVPIDKNHQELNENAMCFALANDRKFKKKEFRPIITSGEMKIPFLQFLSIKVLIKTKSASRGLLYTCLVSRDNFMISIFAMIVLTVDQMLTIRSKE